MILTLALVCWSIYVWIAYHSIDGGASAAPIRLTAVAVGGQLQTAGFRRGTVAR